jgi:hypothetical protein
LEDVDTGYPEGMDLPSTSLDGYPEGMDRHNTGAAPALLWKRMLDVGSIGSSETFASVAEAARGKRVIDIRGDDRKPEIITITTAVLEESNVKIVDGDTVAVLQWGVQNYQAKAEIDMVQGQMASILASSLTVLIKSNTLDPNITTPRYGVQVSYGQRANQRPPQRTIKGGAAAAGGGINAVTNVPSFAKTLTPLPLITLAGVNSLDFSIELIERGAIATRIPISWSVTSGMSPIQKIPLPNDVRQVVTRNIDALNAMASIRYIYELAL